MFKKKKSVADDSPKYIKRMAGQDYIDKTREYLDYIEEHLLNISKAFDELSDAADGKEPWVGDDCTWHTFREEVLRHDLSKFSKEEFVQYRDNFHPVNDYDKENSGFTDAWENHKKENHHHHQTAEHFMDVVHMLIDWLAMSYKFNSNPRDYYDKTKHDMNLEDKYHVFIENHFSYIESYRKRKAK